MISVQRVLELHAAALRHANQVPASTPHPDCVEGVISYAMHWALMQTGEDEPDPLIVAACLIRGFTSGNCFPDGNKRIGWLSAMDVLLEHGLTVEATQEQAAEMVLALATREMDLSGVASWLSSRVRAAD